VVIVLAIRPKVCGLKPCRRQSIFKGDKNPYHDFLRRRNKAVGSISKDFYGMLKTPAEYKGDTSQAKFTVISSQVSPASLHDVSAGCY
jgi:hypothetical protein